VPDLDAGVERHQLVIGTMEAIKKLVHEQAACRANANPGSSWNLIVDIEVDGARDRLWHLSEDLRTEGDREGAALVAALIEDWLPVLAQELRGRV
jgi:hypothetical protein